MTVPLDEETRRRLSARLGDQGAEPGSDDENLGLDPDLEALAQDASDDVLQALHQEQARRDQGRDGSTETELTDTTKDGRTLNRRQTTGRRVHVHIR